MGFLLISQGLLIELISIFTSLKIAIYRLLYVLNASVLKATRTE